MNYSKKSVRKKQQALHSTSKKRIPDTARNGTTALGFQYPSNRKTAPATGQNLENVESHFLRSAQINP